MGTLANEYDNLESRINLLEREIRGINEKIYEIKITSAQVSERQKGISEKVNKIDAGVGRILLLVAGGFISAAVMWVVQGGLFS